MAFRRNKDLGRDYTALFACCFVGMGGLLSCFFIVFTFADNPKRPLVIWLSVVAGLSLILWLLRDKPKKRASTGFLALLARKPPRYDYNYLPRARKPHPLESDEPQPPSVEKIRELKQGLNTWVPSQQAGDKSKNARRGVSGKR